MLISVHIPKCAGTTFRHLLQERYGDRLVLNYGVAFWRDQAAALTVPPAAECIHGHFLADTFAASFPAARMVTWVRDPVQRVVSHYHQFLRSPDLRDDCCRQLVEEHLSLRQFAGLEWMRNTMTRYLAGIDPDAFACIGVCEDFDRSVAALARAVGWERPRIPARANVNPARVQPCYDLCPADREYLAGLNRADVELHRFALDRLAAWPIAV